MDQPYRRDNNVLLVKCLPLTGPHQFMFPDWFSTFRTAEVLDAEFCDWTVMMNRIMKEFNRMNYRKLSANKVFIRHSYWHIQHNVMKHKQWQIKQGVLLWTHEVIKCPEDRRQFDQRVLIKSQTFQSPPVFSPINNSEWNIWLSGHSGGLLSLCSSVVPTMQTFNILPTADESYLLYLRYEVIHSE